MSEGLPAPRAPGDGDRQRHPRLLLRRRPLRHHRGRRRPRPAAARAGRRPPRHRRRVHPARRHPAARRRRARPGRPGHPRAGRRRRRRLRRHDARRGRGGRARGRRPVVNDVSGGLADPAILDVVAGSDATYVAMHWRAHADRMRDFADYEPDGVVAAVRRELGERLDAAVAAGIPRERIVLDPGLGFAKTAAPQLGAARGARRARRAGLPAARRCEPQVVPRHPAGRRRRPAAGRRARARTRGAGGAPGRPRCRLPARARRTRHPRRARRRRRPASDEETT